MAYTLTEILIYSIVTTSCVCDNPGMVTLHRKVLAVLLPTLCFPYSAAGKGGRSFGIKRIEV